MVEVADDDVDEVVHVAGEGVAGDDFFPLVDEGGEGGDGVGVVAGQLDADEGLQAEAQAFGVDFGAVAGDHTLAFEALDAAQAGGGGEVDAFGQLGVGLAAGALEFGQQQQVGAVEVDGRHGIARKSRFGATILRPGRDSAQSCKPIARASA